MPPTIILTVRCIMRMRIWEKASIVGGLFVPPFFMIKGGYRQKRVIMDNAIIYIIQPDPRLTNRQKSTLKRDSTSLFPHSISTEKNVREIGPNTQIQYWVPALTDQKIVR